MNRIDRISINLNETKQEIKGSRTNIAAKKAILEYQKHIINSKKSKLNKIDLIKVYK